MLQGGDPEVESLSHKACSSYLTRHCQIALQSGYNNVCATYIAYKQHTLQTATCFCFSTSSHHYMLSLLIIFVNLMSMSFIGLFPRLGIFFHWFMGRLSFFFHKSPSHNLCPFSTIWHFLTDLLILYICLILFLCDSISCRYLLSACSLLFLLSF